MLDKIRKHGLKGIAQILYLYKIPDFYRKIFSIILYPLKERNVIVFESMNDFDMNSGELCNFFIKNNIQNRYKLVWLVKNKYKIDKDSNFAIANLFGPSIKREYYCNIAKYIFYDNYAIRKRRETQTVIYCGHATRAMKNCCGVVARPDDIDYCLSSSSFNDSLMSEVYCVDRSKFITTGFPVTDILCKSRGLKVISKTIIWMPTFRKAILAENRNDSTLITPTGLPLISTTADCENLSNKLKALGYTLIIKLHPAQDVNAIHIQDTDNIKLYTPQKIKGLGIDTYELLVKSSALISDYSSISFDYLLLDRPIAYVLSDYNEYKLGFAVDNPKDFMPGDYIYTMDDMVKFIESVAAGEDPHKKERNELKDKIHTYQDGKSCERIVQFLGL